VVEVFCGPETLEKLVYLVLAKENKREGIGEGLQKCCWKAAMLLGTLNEALF